MGKMPKRGRKRRRNRSIKPEFIRLKRWIMSLFCFLITMMSAISSHAQEPLWHKSDNGIDETRITALCVIKEAPQIIFAGSERAVYKSVDAGKGWLRVFMLKGQRKGINFIAYHLAKTYKIYLACADGLYLSPDGGENWKRVFRGRDDLQREVISIAIDKDDPSSIFIATKRGLFQSKDAGQHWLSINSFINKEMSSVAIGNKAVYVCAIDGVYYAKKGSELWERIYVRKASEEEDVNGDNENGDADEEKKVNSLSQITIYEERAYLAADRGIFVFREAEKRWQAFNSEGLLTEKIRFILSTPKGVFAATDKGVFSYDENNKRWSSISSGLASPDVNLIDFAPKEGSLYAATDRGIYKAKLNSTQSPGQPLTEYGIEAAIGREPAISEIQQAAIEYAEVSPKKIEWMRRSAKNKAWLPKVSAGLDGDIDRTLDLDRGGTANPDFYIEGPKDKGWGWDIDLTWDLGELIWNQDQCNIDVRSKLMVQLRNDLLDEVTKLYFERRRLQLELSASMPEEKDERTLKQLRLEELTADIDALTGGYLSGAIKK